MAPLASYQATEKPTGFRFTRLLRMVHFNKWPATADLSKPNGRFGLGAFHDRKDANVAPHRHLIYGLQLKLAVFTAAVSGVDGLKVPPLQGGQKETRSRRYQHPHNVV